MFFFYSGFSKLLEVGTSQNHEFFSSRRGEEGGGCGSTMILKGGGGRRVTLRIARVVKFSRTVNF